MKVLVTNTFKRTAKKLPTNQLVILKKAIKHLEENPKEGELKKGDLLGIRVYKLPILHQRVLLAYLYNVQENTLTLLSFSSHENFYKNLKNQLNDTNDIGA